MIHSVRPSVDPSEVLNAIADDFGKYIRFGEQKDICEFNLMFLARVQEAFQLQKK
jgi:hypothetical protein